MGGSFRSSDGDRRMGGWENGFSRPSSYTLNTSETFGHFRQDNRPAFGWRWLRRLRSRRWRRWRVFRPSWSGTEYTLDTFRRFRGVHGTNLCPLLQSLYRIPSRKVNWKSLLRLPPLVLCLPMTTRDINDAGHTWTEKGLTDQVHHYTHLRLDCNQNLNFGTLSKHGCSHKNLEPSEHHNEQYGGIFVKPQWDGWKASKPRLFLTDCWDNVFCGKGTTWILNPLREPKISHRPIFIKCALGTIDHS